MRSGFALEIPTLNMGFEKVIGKRPLLCSFIFMSSENFMIKLRKHQQR